MKNQILVFFLVSISIFSCKKDIVEFQPANPFENIVLVEKQTFELDTIKNNEIIGINGTKIYFNRDDFDLNKNEKVTVELKEYYSRLELMSENLNTVTDKNELLESNGVIYLNFKVADKKINLKKDKKLKLKFAKEFRTEDRIFNGILDSLNQIRWIKKDTTYIMFEELDSILTKRYGGVVTLKEKLIRLDSLEYYRNLNQSKLLNINRINEVDSLIEFGEYDWLRYPPILIDEFGWINVDKILYPDFKISFNLKIDKKNLPYYTAFITYKNLNSFISEYRDINNTSFVDIPIKSVTSLVVVGKTNDSYFSKKIILDQNSSGDLEINLKKTDSTELKDLIKK